MSAANKRIYAITLRKAHSYMKARGFDAADLLANTELSEGDLAEPYNLISEDQARTYYANLVRQVDRDGVAPTARPDPEAPGSAEVHRGNHG